MMKSLLVMMLVGLISASCMAQETKHEVPLNDPHKLVEKVLLPRIRSALVKQSQNRYRKSHALGQLTLDSDQKTSPKRSWTQKRRAIHSGLLSAAE